MALMVNGRSNANNKQKTSPEENTNMERVCSKYLFRFAPRTWCEVTMLTNENNIKIS